ncbi:hypothetical protein OROMI_024449 [Orobanche minor]
MPSQGILKIRDGTPLEAEGILTYRKNPPKLLEILKIRDVQKKRVARILLFKIRPSQGILKIRDGTPLEAEGILTYRKNPPKLLGLMPSQHILKIRDGTPLEMARILVFKIRPSQKKSGTNFDIQKKPSKLLVWHFSSKLDVPSNVVQKKRVARILVFKISPSQEILKILDGTVPLWRWKEF